MKKISKNKKYFFKHPIRLDVWALKYSHNNLRGALI